MSKQIHQWSVEDVSKYITDLQVDGFTFTANEAANFRKEIINGKLLLNLEKKDLNALGIFKFPKRNALYKHIKRLRAEEAEQSRPKLTSFTPITHSPIISTTNSPKNTILRTMASNLSPTFTPNVSTMNPLKPLSSVMTPLILPQSPPTFMSSVTPVLPMPSTINAPNSAAMPFQPIGPQPLGQNVGGFISPFARSPLYGASFPPPQISPSILAPALLPTASPALGPAFTFSGNSPPLIPAMHALNRPMPKQQSVNSSTDALIAQFQHHRVSTSGPRRDEELGDELNVTDIRAVPEQDHLVEFPAIYQGINSHSSTFVLMTQDHVMALNKLYRSLQLQRPKRNAFVPLQGFASTIPTQKVRYGWVIGGGSADRLPFNALVQCTVNLLTDELTKVRPVAVSGRINHVNQYGQTWVTSDVQIDAVEQVAASRSNMVSDIVSLALRNVSHTTLQQRANASYMVHDPENDGDQPEEIWRRGLTLTLCLKLSTRTNRKCNDLRKAVFVQGWNVKVRT